MESPLTTILLTMEKPDGDLVTATKIMRTTLQGIAVCNLEGPMLKVCVETDKIQQVIHAASQAKMKKIGLLNLHD